MFYRFLTPFIYIINTGYWQVLFITEEHLGNSSSATPTFKCQGSTAAILVSHFFVVFFLFLKQDKFLNSTEGRKYKTNVM